MRIGITGASGFIGSAIIAKANDDGHTVVGYSRKAGKIIPGTEETRDYSDPEHADYSGLDSIIHLAGESILGIWTEGKKERVMDSRVQGTAALVRGLRDMEPAKRPKSLVCASAVGFYGERGDDVLDEESDRGFGFLAKVVVNWEAAAQKATDDFGLRVAMPRVGFVLGRNGGALPILKPLFKCCLGGKLGSGKQWMPWVHIDDVARIFLKCVTDQSIQGPLNCASPNPVTNKEFTREMGDALHRPAFLPTPAFALKLLPGGMSEMFLNSQRADPEVLRIHEYDWKFPDLGEALRDLLNNGY